MLRVNASTSAAGAKKYFNEELDRGDYYLDGRDIGGRWHGKGAALLGLSGEVDKDAFHLLCENVHPVTGEQLTPRQKDNRRVGYDFTFSVPKSVSVVHARTGDENILKAFREAIVETMEEMEREMETRVRTNGQNENRTTGNLVWAEFVHFTSRPIDGIPDPHLHAHCYAFNTTFDSVEERWKAGQFGGLKRDAPYYEAAFDARFAQRLVELGYEVERNPARNAKDWQIRGVPDSVLEKFSRRTAEIEAAARERGIRTDRLKAEIGASTRENKRTALSPEHVRAAWNSRLTLEEELSLQAVEGGAAEGDRETPPRVSAAEAMDFALDHSFERLSVIDEKRLLEAALRYGVGAVSVEEIHRAGGENPAILRKETDGITWVTTREVLEEEKAMIAFARDGRGACKRLGRFDFEFSVDFLNSEQKAAVEHVLHSQSRVMVVSGGAGVGKTTLMQEAVRGIEEGGHRAFTFAPSAASSRGVLRSEGFENADTVARLLIDEELQQAVENQVIWIDEAGLLGARSMAQVFQVAEEKNARVVLSGDVRQHSPVERGDALRVLQEHAGIQAVEVRTIQRQRGEYREAVDAISRGGIEEGFDRLDALGAVVEIDDESRHEQLAQDYLRTVIDEGRTALVVSPTHREGEAVTERIREGLREQGVLGESERILVRQVNCSWTEAERADAARYEPGMVVQFHQNAKDYRGKRPMLGMTPKGNVSLVQEYLPEDRRFQLDYDYKGQVSVVGRFEQKGIKRGEKFVVTGRDEQGNVWMRDGAGKVEVLPLDQAKKFQVYQAREIEISRGDRIRISQNGFTKDKKHRLNNGAVYEVAGFTSGGDLRLANGWVVSQDYGNLAHGYCVTSHASQGKTVDRVFVAQGAESFPAASAEQFYVSVSRGRESVAIYTDDREALLEAVRRSGRRQAASELEPEAETAGERARWKAAAMWVNRITDQARSWAARARESLVEKYAGRGPARGGPEGSGPARPPERQAVVDKFAGSARSPEQQAVVDKYTGRGRTAEQQDLVDKYTKRTPKREELVEKYTGKPTKKGGRDDRGTRDRDEE